jgi:hypothetical protein
MSPIDKVYVEFNVVLEFVIELIYNERASAITVEFVVLLRNVLTVSIYINKNMHKKKNRSILYHTWASDLDIQVPLDNRT